MRIGGFLDLLIFIALDEGKEAIVGTWQGTHSGGAQSDSAVVFALPDRGLEELVGRRQRNYHRRRRHILKSLLADGKDVESSRMRCLKSTKTKSWPRTDLPRKRRKDGLDDGSSEHGPFMAESLSLLRSRACTRNARAALLTTQHTILAHSRLANDHARRRLPSPPVKLRQCRVLGVLSQGCSRVSEGMTGSISLPTGAARLSKHTTEATGEKRRPGVSLPDNSQLGSLV